MLSAIRLSEYYSDIFSASTANLLFRELITHAVSVESPAYISVSLCSSDMGRSNEHDEHQDLPKEGCLEYTSL